MQYNKILLGDCLEVMKTLEENSVDAIVTDPPYGLSFMGKKWDYEVPSVAIWKEALRVLKPGGYLLSFAGTRTQHRMAVNIEDAGFEIRDMIAWVYGSGFPKSLNIGKAINKMKGNLKESTETLFNNPNKKTDLSKRSDYGYKFEPQSEQAKEWEGWGTALKPALEPITVARKPLSEKSVAENVLKWGVGGINIDGSRVGTEEISVHNAPKGTFAGGEMDRGSDTESYRNHTGRFPANLIHDGSDEVVELFPNTGKGNGEKPYNYSGREYDNKETSMFNGDKPQAPSNFNDSGSASRFFYCAKASKAERGETNNHPTVKPIALMEYLVKLVSKEDAVVLDPFAGSGSTLIACKNLKRNYIGIEMESDYVKIAEARLSGVKIENTLF